MTHRKTGAAWATVTTVLIAPVRQQVRAALNWRTSIFHLSLCVTITAGHPPRQNCQLPAISSECNQRFN